MEGAGSCPALRRTMNIRLGLISGYSLLYGVHKPEKILDRAAAYGIKTLSICDINNLYGVHAFIEAARERGIKPVIGAALTNSKEQISNSKGVVYCFVENRAGFGRLCEILTNSKEQISDNRCSIIAMLRENSAGLVLASAGKEILQSLAGRVRRLYAAITPDDLGGLNPHKTLALPLAFLDTSAFLDKSDYAVHRVLRAIGLNKTIGDPLDTLGEGTGIFKTSSELRERFKSWPESIKGTAEIAESAEFDKIFNGFVFPSYGEAPVEELRRRAFKGAFLRYGALGDGEIERIEYELNIIEKMGFSPYFLVIDDIVKMAKGSKGDQASKGSQVSSRSQRTCGRGSGAASIVSYSLGITNVDPIAHNLYFERFLNPARPDPPDIDVDFAWDERDELIKAVIDRYGPEHCARVANHNFFRPRSALRETAKAYGFSDGAISQLERKIFDLREKEENIDPLWKEIYGIASRIEGLPRVLSMHCGGLVITPTRISRYAPVEKSTEGFPLLAWEKDGTESAGLVKIDLLGNRSLAVIRDAVINIKEQIINDDDIEDRLSRAINDKETIEALARGDSMGVFYIESPAMRQLQKKTGTGDFEHIVIHSSIIRPAANKFITEYVRRLKGGKWTHLHPRLEYILDETYGILCYQEDVSKTAIALAGFGEVDADKLRKVIAKKSGGAKLAIYEKQFFDGCRKNGVPEETIKNIWAMMLSFDGYSFCKPHSASYAMVSFQSAFLRVHHPAEFMAAVLSNQGGYYRPGAYISESRRMGLFVEGPDINLSRWKYYGTGRRLVIGLMAIKGLSASGAEKILSEREKRGEYKSLEDFNSRVRSGRDDIVALCPAGVFDSIAGGLSRAMQARCLLSNSKEQISNNKGNLELFENEFITGNKKSVNKIIPNSSLLAADLLWEEYRALGFLRNVHSLTLWKTQILPLKRIKARHIAEYLGQNVKMLGWPITQKEVWTKDGLTMSFLSLEDETALYETVIFPEIYNRFNKLLFDQQPLLVYGKIMSDNGAISLEINKIETLGKNNLPVFQ